MPDLKVKCKTASVGGIKTKKQPEEFQNPGAAFWPEDFADVWDEWVEHSQRLAKLTNNKDQH